MTGKLLNQHTALGCCVYLFAPGGSLLVILDDGAPDGPPKLVLKPYLLTILVWPNTIKLPVPLGPEWNLSNSPLKDSEYDIAAFQKSLN